MALFSLVKDNVLRVSHLSFVCSNRILFECSTDLRVSSLMLEGPNGGIPHTRRTECAKMKISQSDFSSLKFGKTVNISRD